MAAEIEDEDDIVWSPRGGDRTRAIDRGCERRRSRVENDDGVLGPHATERREHVANALCVGVGVLERRFARQPLSLAGGHQNPNRVGLCDRCPKQRRSDEDERESTLHSISSRTRSATTSASDWVVRARSTALASPTSTQPSVGRSSNLTDWSEK